MAETRSDEVKVHVLTLAKTRFTFTKQNPFHKPKHCAREGFINPPRIGEKIASDGFRVLHFGMYVGGYVNNPRE